MATKHKKARARSLEQVIADVALYPPEAYEFVQEGLSLTVERIHGAEVMPADESAKPGRSRHVSGQELAEGLRQYAMMRWGLLARVVLQRWNITCTLDFGRIVFALIDAGQLQKTSEDSIDDFRNVFEFRKAFEGSYQIEPVTLDGR